MIKFHRIDRLYEIHRKPIQDLMDKTYSSGQVLQGKAVKRLEERLASMCDRKYAIAVGSCTDALSLSLIALKVDKFDTVLVNDFTFDAPKTCILRVGASPIKWADELTDKNNKLTAPTEKAMDKIYNKWQKENEQLQQENAKLRGKEKT